MKMPVNDNDKNKMFNDLENKIMKEITSHAEVIKQKEIIKGTLEQENIRMMTEMMNNMNKSNLYGLDTQQQMKNSCQQIQDNKHVTTNVKQSIVKGKEKIIMFLVLIIMIILAIGVTPSGVFWESLQTSYVELLVDAFRMALLGIGGYLTFKLFKK